MGSGSKTKVVDTPVNQGFSEVAGPALAVNLTNKNKESLGGSIDTTINFVQTDQGSISESFLLGRKALMRTESIARESIRSNEFLAGQSIRSNESIFGSALRAVSGSLDAVTRIARDSVSTISANADRSASSLKSFAVSQSTNNDERMLTILKWGIAAGALVFAAKFARAK